MTSEVRPEIMDGVKRDFDLDLVIQGFQKCHGSDGAISLRSYLNAFQELCRFFQLMGKIFGFVAKDLQDKIAVLELHMSGEQGSHYETVQSMLEYETNAGKARCKSPMPSGSRTLLRLHWALEFILEFIASTATLDNNVHISRVAAETYHVTLGRHHPWFVRKMAYIVMYTLPTRGRLISVMCKHDPERVEELFEPFDSATRPVWKSIQSLYEDYQLTQIL